MEKNKHMSKLFFILILIILLFSVYFQNKLMENFVVSGATEASHSTVTSTNTQQQSNGSSCVIL